MLLSRMSCSACGTDMSERPEKDNYRYCFICDSRSCAKYRNNNSVRHGSFFEDFRLSLINVFTVIYLCAENKAFSDISRDFGLNKYLISKIIKKIRLKVKTYFIDSPIKLGGAERVCQIDENLFVHKVKYNRGRRPSGQI